MTNSPERSWCFVINNPTDDCFKHVELFARIHAVTRMTVGKENFGEEGKTPHLQGALCLRDPIRRKALSEALGGRANIEKMICGSDGKKSHDPAFEYCRKDGDVLMDIDNRTGKGRRTDLINACELLKEGGIEAVVAEMPSAYVKYASGFDKLSFKLQRPRSKPPTVWWLHGPTGTGKTRLVFESERPNDLWVSGDDLRWFDGYDGHAAAVFDDFRGDMCRLRWLLRLLDRYPVRVQVKGSHVEWKPKRIYITSAKAPNDAYSTEDEKINQLTRRITKVIDTSVPGWDDLLQHLRIR